MRSPGSRVVAGDPHAGGVSFRRGWFASTRPGAPPVTTAWPEIGVGALTVRVHPAQDHAVGTAGGAVVVVVGHVLDTVEGTGDQRRLVDDLAVAASAGREAVLRRIAYLGGRFVVLAARGDRLLVVPDATATIPAYWTAAGGHLDISSHDTLTAEPSGAAVDTDLVAVMRAARADSPYVVFAPGARTFRRGVRPVLPNHALEWSGEEASHERFYPFPDTELTDDGYARFRHHFTEHVRLLGEDRAVTVSLTAGRDSRASFAALRRVHHPRVSA